MWAWVNDHRRDAGPVVPFGRPARVSLSPNHQAMSQTTAVPTTQDDELSAADFSHSSEKEDEKEDEGTEDLQSEDEGIDDLHALFDSNDNDDEDEMDEVDRNGYNRETLTIPEGLLMPSITSRLGRRKISKQQKDESN
jgi:hypothetical protein